MFSLPNVEYAPKYFTHMENASDDKSKILKYLKDGMHILDVGAGNGALTKRILNVFPNCTVDALDASETCLSYLNDIAKQYNKNMERMHVIDANFLTYGFENERSYDAVIFCSCIHEIFSFTEPKFCYNTIACCIRNAISLVKTDGLIIVRDGVAPDTNKQLAMRIMDDTFKKLANKFVDNFQGFIPYFKERNGLYYTDEKTAAEMMLTCNWGESSFAREIQEYYTYFSVNDWKSLLKYFKAVDIEMLCTYTQHEYKIHLNNKVNCIYMESDKEFFPKTNMLMVVKKR